MLIEDNIFPEDLSYPIPDKVIYYHWLKNQLDNSPKVLWVLTLPHFEPRWLFHFNRSLEKLTQRPDKILITARSEIYSDLHWTPVIDRILELGYSKSDIMIVSGTIDSPLSDITYHHDFIFLNRYQIYDNLKYTDIFNRDYKFVSLSGTPRPNRVLFTKELLSRELDKQGIITCGSATDILSEESASRLYDLLELGEYRHCFPVVHGSTYQTTKTADLIPSEFLNAAYHVVLETCFEDHLNFEAITEFARVFTKKGKLITEKTTKVFSSYQLPLFVATQGYVKGIRALGFDLFDDVIDHSYDDIVDPMERMIAVANEVQRLVNLDLPKDKNIKKRLLKNHDHVELAYLERKNSLAMNILKWFNQ